MKLKNFKNNSTKSLTEMNLQTQQQTMHTTEQETYIEGFDWDEALKVAEEYQASKQPAQQLSGDCIQEFKEMIALYLESSELTPWQFIACLKAALAASLKEQNYIKDSLRNTLLLIEGNGDD